MYMCNLLVYAQNIINKTGVDLGSIFQIKKHISYQC